MLATEVVPQDVGAWAVGLVLTGVVSILGFLARNAVAKVEHGIETLGSKMDSLRAALSQSDGDRRVLEVRVEGIAREVSELRAELRKLEGVAR